MIQYKVVVLSVEGTLINELGLQELPEQTISTLLKVQQMGVRIVLDSKTSVENLQPLIRQIELHHYGGYAITSDGATIVDIEQNEQRSTPPNTKKEEALSILLSTIDTDWTEVMAIGSDSSDITMLKKAGMGVAMANATDEVKACADRTTLSLQEEGAAVAIEQIVIAAIHPTEIPLDQLNERGKHALMGNLGIKYTYAAEGHVEATMPVDERTRQPFGILHGGATLALAETVAGMGSILLAKPDEKVVGMQVSGSHLSSAHEGDTVRAVGTMIHRGRSSHVWNVDIFTSQDKLVSSIRVVNAILKRR